jgi:hypothetical protein
MIATDFDRFFDALQRVAIVCGRQKLMGDVAKTYFSMLEDLPITPLVRAMDKFARTAETGRRFPSPRELREWVSEGRTAPGLTPDEAQRVWLRVNRAMREWEREGKTGSAWPSFEVAWSAACHEEHVQRRASPQNRQDCWQRWLWHGAVRAEEAPMATREQVERILRQTLPRCNPIFGAALRDIADRIHQARETSAREPGEDDD